MTNCEYLGNFTKTICLAFVVVALSIALRSQDSQFRSQEMGFYEATKYTLDEVLENFKVYQWYHLKLSVLVALAYIVAAFSACNYVFVTHHVSYRCNQTTKVCGPNNSSIDKEPHNPFYRIIEYLDAKHVDCLNDTASASNVLEECTEWEYDDPTSFAAEFGLANHEWERTMPGTMHSLGYGVGLLIVGPLSDKLGRKTMGITTALLGSAIGISKTFVYHFWTYLSLEFIEAVLGDCCSPFFMLSMEIVSTSNRGLFNIIPQFAWPLADLLIAFFAYKFQYWRYFLRVLYIPGFFIILYIWLIDESPRWLMMKGRKEKAAKMLDNAAKSNSTIIYKEVLDNLTVEDNGESNVSMFKLLKLTFKSRLILTRFIICVYWWIACCFVTYGIMLNCVELDGNKYLNYVFFGLSDIPSSPLSGISLKWMSRKNALFSTFLLTGLLCIARPFIPASIPWLSIGVFMMAKCISSTSFNVIYVYTSEIFPTYTRNSMHALCSALGRIGAILAQQTPLLLLYWSGLPAILFGVSYLIGTILIVYMPDTGDVELPDTVKQAELVSAKKDKAEDDEYDMNVY